MVTKPPRLVAVVSLCMTGPGIVAWFGVEAVLGCVGASVPLFIGKGDGVFLRTFARKDYLGAGHGRMSDRFRLIGWAPTAKRCRVTVGLSCMRSLVRLWLDGLVYLSLLTWLR